MSKLIQLPNGDWLDPLVVEVVRVLPGYVCPHSGRFAPRVVVSGGDYWAVVEFESEDDAESYRDELAAEVNLAAGRAAP